MPKHKIEVTLPSEEINHGPGYSPCKFTAYTTEYLIVGFGPGRIRLESVEPAIATKSGMTRQICGIKFRANGVWDFPHPKMTVRWGTVEPPSNAELVQFLINIIAF